MRTRHAHFEHFGHRGVIIISQPGERANFRNVELALGGDDLIADMDMHDLVIHNLDLAVIGVTAQPMCRQIAAFKMRWAFGNSGAGCINARLRRHSGAQKLIFACGQLHRRNIDRLA